MGQHSDGIADAGDTLGLEPERSQPVGELFRAPAYPVILVAAPGSGSRRVGWGRSDRY